MLGADDAEDPGMEPGLLLRRNTNCVLAVGLVSIFFNSLSKSEIQIKVYRNDPKLWDTHVSANSVDSAQTVPEGAI